MWYNYQKYNVPVYIFNYNAEKICAVIKFLCKMGKETKV